MKKDEWQQCLISSEAALRLKGGFRFVYGPWTTLKTGRVAFLSLNPGKASAHTILQEVSDERGNSYEVEKYTTVSPITDQALRAFSFLGAKPNEVLTGVVCPFRTPSWSDLSKVQRDTALDLGKAFWSEPLNRSELELIICCSTKVTRAVTGWLGARHEASLPAHWGDISIHRYRTRQGIPILALPHLSRFRLFGRPQSEASIRQLLA